MTHRGDMLVDRLQTGLQDQYDLAIPYQVDQFVSHDARFARHMTSTETLPGNRSASDAPERLEETVFIRQSDDTLEFTVYLDHEVLNTASAHTHTDDSGRVHAYEAHSLDQICTVVEGVSHAVCLLWHAHHDRQLRALDLELQAEVDKYMILMDCSPDDASRSRLHSQLFDKARITAPVDSALHERYKAASDFAATYCEWLSQTFPGPAERQNLNHELSRFYRLSGSAKFERIRRLH